MKKQLTVLALVFFVSASVTYAQLDKSRITAKNTQISQLARIQFTQEDQTKIQKVLGNDFKAVLGKDGQLGLVKPELVGQIKSTPKGGFSTPPGAAANAVFAAYEKAWVYKQSSKDILLGKLGQERFNQLAAIMKTKGINM